MGSITPASFSTRAQNHPRRLSYLSSETKLEPSYDSKECRARYDAYSKLQACAVAFGEQLPIPEIVAVGGQSDGKSSLLEALLGFRFNVREVEMGTRRPLMLQMVHDASATEPRCRIQDEDSNEYGSIITSSSAVAEAIRARTEEHLKKIQAAVSGKPIVMRVEYAFCPNLTIIDTPGFVLKAKKGEPESTPDDIIAMVRTLTAPPNRLLLFLQQSSVEWCSSLWLDTIRSIDPSLHRTIIVVSKFDNRLTEFVERWEVDRYLSASGYLGENVYPFFVALPKERGLVSNEEFRNQIASVDAEVLRHLQEKVKGGFDDDKYGSHVGFRNLRQYLETELHRRYKEAAPAMLALLERRCSEVSSGLSNADARLAAAADVASLRRAAMTHTAALAKHVGALLNGAADPDPAEWGWTTEEERLQSGVTKWPGLVKDICPPNAILKLYGGAAFERVLTEFRCAACSLEYPSVSREKVANILLAHSGRAGGVAAAAASLARAAARSWLGPLLDTTCERLAHVLRNLFDLAVQRIRLQTASDDSLGKGMSGIFSYVAFHAALRRAHDQFIQDLTKESKELLQHHLTAATSPYSQLWSYEDRGLLTGSGLNVTSMEVLGGLGPQSGLLTEERENVAPYGLARMQSTPAKLFDPRDPLRESQLTVPDTPSPDQNGNESGMGKRKEAGRRFVDGEVADPAIRKKDQEKYAQKKDPRGASGVYNEVCSLAAEQFTKIREMLVDRTIPATLYASFLIPCRDQLALAMGLDLFAVSDEKFMDMFAAPGMIDQLENERASMQKRCKTLRLCLNEFRTMARSL